MKRMITMSIMALLLASMINVKEVSAQIFLFKFGTDGSGDGEFADPQGVAVDSTGNIYVADTDNDRIQKFNSNGNFILTFGTLGFGNGQFDGPQGVAVDSTGNIYVADTINNRIQKFNSKGKFILKFGTPGTGDGQFVGPEGVAVDSTGNIYIADTFNNRIQKFDSNGNFILTFGTLGFGNGQFDNPSGVAVDSSSNIYVADTFNNRIQVFGADTDGDGVPDLEDNCPDDFNPDQEDKKGDAIEDVCDSDGKGCSVASAGSTPSIPLYLLIPVFIVIRRL